MIEALILQCGRVDTALVIDIMRERAAIAPPVSPALWARAIIACASTQPAATTATVALAMKEMLAAMSQAKQLDKVEIVLRMVLNEVEAAAPTLFKALETVS